MSIAFAAGAAYAIQGLATKPSLAAVSAERAAFAQWPQVPATLYRLTLVKERTGRGPGVTYSPKVKYRFYVGSESVEGNQLMIENSWRWFYQANTIGDFRTIVASLAPGLDFQKFLDAPQCQDLGGYDSCSIGFDLEQPTRVYVDPRNPQNSVFDIGIVPPANLLDQRITPLMWIACLLLSLVASIATAWSMLLRLPEVDTASGNGGASWSLRLWHIAGGLFFVSVSLESYILIHGWRTAPEGIGELMGWLPGIALCATSGLLGAYLMAQPLVERKLQPGGRRRRR
jgi:hypothetical protein